MKHALGVAALNLLLGASVLLNIFLASEIKNLRSSVTLLKADGILQVGARVPALVGHSDKGIPQTLSYSESAVPTVLYVFTPQCAWCKKNLNNLRVLIDNAGPNYHIVGVSLATKDLPQYLEAEHLSFPVYTNLDDTTRIAYRMSGTPSTIIVSPDSKVMKVWTGAYQDGIRQEI